MSSQEWFESLSNRDLRLLIESPFTCDRSRELAEQELLRRARLAQAA